jgi:hypothetical protein
MQNVDGTISTEESKDLISWRVERRQSLSTNVSPVRSLVSPLISNPTRELDALVLGNALIGYGDNVSLENMTIIENIIKFSKMEATLEVPGDKKPKEWHQAFLKCMEDLGCYVPDSGVVEYNRGAVQLTMSNVLTGIVKAGIEAAKAAIPGATVLGAVADSTLDALKKEPDVVKLFHFEVTKAKGVKLAILPCEQLKNGLIMIMLSSIYSESLKSEGGVIFLDATVEDQDVFRAASFITFNPLRYAQNKASIERVLDHQQDAQLTKRFNRTRQKA